MPPESPGTKIALMAVSALLAVITALLGVMLSILWAGQGDVETDLKQQRDAFASMATEFAVMRSKVDDKLGDNALLTKTAEENRPDV